MSLNEISVRGFEQYFPANENWEILDYYAEHHVPKDGAPITKVQQLTDPTYAETPIYILVAEFDSKNGFNSTHLKVSGVPCNKEEMIGQVPSARRL